MWIPSLLRASSSLEVITSQPPSQGSGPDVWRKESGLCSPLSPCPPSPQISLLRSQGDKGQRGLAFGSQHQGKHLKHSPTVMVAEPGVHSVWLAPHATVARNWKCHLWPEDRNSFFLSLSSFKCKKAPVSHSWCLLY